MAAVGAGQKDSDRPSFILRVDSMKLFVWATGG